MLPLPPNQRWLTHRRQRPQSLLSRSWRQRRTHSDRSATFAAPAAQPLSSSARTASTVSTLEAAAPVTQAVSPVVGVVGFLNRSSPTCSTLSCPRRRIHPTHSLPWCGRCWHWCGATSSTRPRPSRTTRSRADRADRDRQLGATDAEGDALTYTVTEQPVNEHRSRSRHVHDRQGDRQLHLHAR